jgi:DegV family protein with EDD domain
MLAIITDSTCDLSATELEALGVERVHLYVHFRGETHRDWLDIDPAGLIEGVAAGADLPSTSQPSPQDFEDAFRAAMAAGATEILCITISSELSGTLQSATLAAEAVEVPVTLFDSRHTSLGLGDMVKEASQRRAAGQGVAEIVPALEHIRDTNFVIFTVGTLDFLQKGGRIGGAAALLGGLLNIKPILGLRGGKVEALGRARGSKRALRELLSSLEEHRQQHPGDLVINFIHVQDVPAAEALKVAIDELGVPYEDAGIYEMGSVIAAHVGPGTSGIYVHTKPA